MYACCCCLFCLLKCLLINNFFLVILSYQLLPSVTKCFVHMLCLDVVYVEGACTYVVYACCVCMLCPRMLLFVYPNFPVNIDASWCYNVVDATMFAHLDLHLAPYHSVYHSMYLMRVGGKTVLFPECVR